MWNDLVSKQDIDQFMDMICCFHDSCIKELKYISGAYVTDHLSMHPVNDQRKLNIIIQRQFKNRPVIEMEFTGLKHLRLFPVDEKYTTEILSATMVLKGDCIYWCDDNISEQDFETYAGTLICASNVRWRCVDKYLGPKEVYGSV